MAIPWMLLGTVVVAALTGGLWAWWRSSEDAPLGPAIDLATSVAIGGIVGGRLGALLADLFLSGTLPSLGGIASITAGLSTPGAVVGGLAAGAWAQRRARTTGGEVRGPVGSAGVWHLGVPAAALGLAAWSLLALVRGDAAGVVAPPPLGWPMPGEAEPRVPVALLEAMGYLGLFAWARSRAGRSGRTTGARLGAHLAAGVAALHLLGTLGRPTPATGDADFDVLLGLATLLGALVAAAAPRAAAVRTTAAALVAVAAVVVVAGLSIDPAGRARAAGSPATSASLEGAISAAGAGARPPAWGLAELEAFVAEHDRPVVVNFWASWCPPCHGEAPVLSRTAMAHDGEVAFVGVLVRDDPASAAAFARRYGLAFPTVIDAGLRAALGAVGLPTTVVLRPDGSVAHRTVGGIDARGLAAAIDRAR